MKILLGFNVDREVSAGIVGGIYYKTFFFDQSRPLIITFSNMGEITRKKDLLKSGYCPWGYKFVRNRQFNVLSFSCFEEVNWYRSEKFYRFIERVGKELKGKFSKIYGYAGSMGGYAAGAFAKPLGIDKLLLMNPISSLSAKHSPFETRYKKYRDSLDWDGEYNDAAVSTCSGYIVYDPIFHLDVRHALRFSNLKALYLPGVGHGIPSHLKNIGMLSWLFDRFVSEDVDVSSFNEKALRRRDYPHYYKWMTSSENIHLTPRRKEILDHYQRSFLMKKGGRVLSDSDVDKIRDIAMQLENVDMRISYELMSIALKARPEGSFIKWKVDQYTAKIKNI